MAKQKELMELKQGKVIQKGEIEKLIELAVERKADIQVLERLFDLRERYKREWAKKRFLEDFSLMQAELPEVTKDQVVLNKDGSVRYKYATLDTIIKTVKPTLEKYGFSYFFKTEKTETGVKVTCVLLHKDGHSEEASFDAPVDASSYMSPIQQYGSAITYAKRYSFCALLGITAEEDDDAQVQETDAYEEVYQYAKLLGLWQYEKVRNTLRKAQREGRPVDVMLNWLDRTKRAFEEQLNGKVKHLKTKEENNASDSTGEENKDETHQAGNSGLPETS